MKVTSSRSLAGPVGKKWVAVPASCASVAVQHVSDAPEVSNLEAPSFPHFLLNQSFPHSHALTSSVDDCVLGATNQVEADYINYPADCDKIQRNNST